MPGIKAETQLESTLNYSIVKDGQKPFNWINEPPQGTPKSNVIPVEYTYPIQDLRSSDLEYGLDQSGFDFERRDTQMRYPDWADDQHIRSVYYAEIEQLFKNKLGAHKVTIFDHTIRRQPPKGKIVKDTPETRAPVAFVHVDQTPESARNRVKKHDPEQAEELLKGRVRLINVWRPLRGPVLDHPLAVADFRTMDTKTDLEPSDLIYSPEQIGQTFMVTHNDAHRWYYADQMQPDEILLLKCYDSASPVTAPVDGIASLTPHTAFADVRYKDKDGVDPRESIEVRALVYTN